jgi:hypothetical protein
VKRDPTHPSPFPELPKASPSMKPPVDLATFKKQASGAPRQFPADAPTMAPPPSEQDVTVTDAELDPFEIEVDEDEGGASARVTITNEVELETARLQ